MAILYQNVVNDAAYTPGVARRVSALAFAATASGAANKITVFTNEAGHQFKVGIYDNGSPIANAVLVGSESTIETSVENGFVTLTLPTPASLVSGQTYRFSICSNTNLSIFGANNAISGSRANGPTLTAISDPLPNPWAAATSNSSGIRMPYVVIESTSVSISGIDKLDTAQTSTATFNADFAATSFSVSDGTTTKASTATTVNSASASFVAPAWVDGETAVKIGTVTVTATDGTDTTTAFSDELEFWSGHPDNATVVKFTAVTLTSVDPDNIGAAHNFNFDPPLKVGTQVIFDSARFSVINGKVESADLEDYQGQSIFWFLDPDDHIAQDFTLDTSEGAVAPVMPADRTVTVYEGATTLGTFPAASGTTPISYAIGGDDDELFTINSATAKVDPVDTLTTGQNGVITVSATNSAGSDTQTINWSVIALPEGESLLLSGKKITATSIKSKSLTGSKI